MRDERWMRDELKALVRDLKRNAKENCRQAAECQSGEPKRAGYLTGGAESLEYAAREIGRVLKGKTSAEAMAELLRRTTVL